MSQPSLKYQYSSLPDDNTSIRLLTLLRGPFSAAVCVLLHDTKLEDGSTHQFEALSYTWGSTDHPEKVIVKTPDRGDFVLPVTQNLSEALQHLRYEHSDRILWIDAICINQADLVERSKQVKHMVAIYSGARQVIVWLGPEADDSSLALQTLEMLSTKIEVDFNTQLVKSAGGDPSEKHWGDSHVELPFSEKQWMSICAIIFRSWFGRLWIWQEVRLAQNAILTCGYHHISWEAFRKSLICLSEKHFPPYLLKYGYYKRRTLLFNLCDQRTLYFRDTIQQTRESICTDPRDRIHALQAIILDCNPQFQADYTKTVPETYRDFFVEELRRTQRIALLGDCEAHTREYEMPSWVPDFSKPKQSVVVSLYAHANTTAHVVSLGEKRMTVTGIFLTTVKNVAPSNILTDSYEELIALNIKKMVQSLNQPQIWTSSKNSELLCSTICAGEFANSYYPAYEYLSRLQECVEALLALLELKDGDQDDLFRTKPVRYLFDRSRQYLTGRALIELGTPSGDGVPCLGLGPSCAEKDDIVAVLLGCDAPMVLRKAANETYIVVGEAYIHGGVTNGESLLGPLHQDIEFVVMLDETANTYPAFLNRGTATITAEDPRLSSIPLPPGWNKELDKIGRPWFFRDGSLERTRSDPRASKESLLSRGVDLRTFTLE